jgi:gliding motility-associated-like protein
LDLEGKNEGFTYFWSTGDTTSLISIQKPGTFWLKTKAEKCERIDTIFIKGIPVEPPALGPDTIICSDFGESILLDAGEGITYNWYPNGEKSKTILVSETGLYFVIKTDTNNCVSADSIEVFDACKGSLYIPNAFCPNGINKIFKPLGTGIETYKMSIFDHWGEKKFETKNPETGWNGYYKDLLCPAGWYYYVITVKLKGLDEKHISGGVLLIR